MRKLAGGFGAACKCHLERNVGGWPGRADTQRRARWDHGSVATPLSSSPPPSQATAAAEWPPRGSAHSAARRAVRSRAGVDLSALLRSEGCARPPAVAGAAGHGQHVFQVRGLLCAGSRSPSSRADGKGRPTRSIRSHIACWGRTFCPRPRDACTRVAARGRPRISSTDRERAILESAGLRRPARGRPWGFWASTTGKSGG